MPPAASAKRNTPTSSSSLRDDLAAVLPQGHRFGIHHVSTPPSRSEPLCPAPPGERPDKTYREQHFLAVSIRAPDPPAASLKRASPGADQPKEPETQTARVLVFAVEVFVFTTAYQTTFFVSKADSTGYLHLIGLPKGAASPIRQVCSAFIAHLLRHRRRKHIESVVNLFARSQAQYLFPGSVRNKGKHVLDDWGLVKWWCKTLNPLLEGSVEGAGSAKGYLLVPGLEELETRAFIPRTTASVHNWDIGHPLESISHYARDFDQVPPRCLIPAYPDDPKSRFRDELDEEVSKRKQGISQWKSVRTLSQFWEMMAFRQECSSGRLTGFIWLVFDHHPGSSRPAAASATQVGKKSAASVDGTPPSRTKASKKKSKKKLSGPVVPRAPRIKTHARQYHLERPTTTAYYFWPLEGRGDKIVNESAYKRIVELLLHLDFSTLEKAVGSSQRWINEVGAGTGLDGEVVGRATVPRTFEVNGAPVAGAGGTVANLTGLVRRKNSTQPSEIATKSDSAPQPAGSSNSDTATKPVNVLGANLVRKKKRDGESY